MIYNTTTNFNRQNYLRFCQERAIKKTSSGLGFFAFAYLASMYATSIAFGVIFGATSLTSIDTVTTFYLEIFISVFSAFMPGLFYFLFSGRSMSETIKTNYVRQKELWALVFVGMAVAMVANTVSDMVQTNFSFFGLQNSVSMSENVSSPLKIVLYIISTAIVPAFAEEFAFRGIFMGTLRKFGDTFAIITSAIVFGAMHGNIAQIPFAFILGLVFAYVDCKTNSILPSIIIHFLNNFYAVMLDILQSTEMFSDRIFMIIYFILIAVFCILGLISFFYLIKKDKNFFRIADKTIQNSESETTILLTLKEKMKAFFINPGVIFVLSVFIIETVISLEVI
ncbi:CPBP family intramembrane glutamic endopeptidase [Ruminococcus sp.]|uniref:CPBP family intramembrane glutamic endopeptidase n=1 Tax=Ruminococcus sp. TaxID=41978 RepID=UPI00262C5D8F|nr:type II CAAX endopeptidase family protein [Ruminococcus sp.]MDD6988937.1 type II CAAX endopeptidase family protein [Ruminococcus sp.]MDY6201297.1 type II CAAX endopeptidase family protein [Ruminococcus sp.]